MRKNNINFQPGEPLPAAKHNGLVFAAEEQVTAFAGEHDPAGRHLHVRFEFAACLAAWTGAIWEIVFGDRASIVTISRSSMLVRISDPDEEVLDHNALGVIAMDSDGYVIPWTTSNRVGTFVQFTLDARDTSQEVSVIVLARRSVGDS